MIASEVEKRPTDSSRLMRRLREVLGGANLTIQEKLDRVVQIVASEMHSDVCSIYVKSAGNVLVLFATEGLNPLAVHYTRMHVGEGVIGDIAANARPLVLSDVKSHPNFAYRPETGENPLQSFLGVPLSRGGKILGVLAVQSKDKRLYDYMEVELLQTVGMIITELIASHDFFPLQPLSRKEGGAWLATELTGLSLNAGPALGIAVFHQVFPLYSLKVAANIHHEKRRLQRSLAEMQSSLNTLFARNNLNPKGDHQEIFEVYQMLAFDRGWHYRLNQAIEKGLSAEAAVEQVLSDLKRVMGTTQDAFWRARIADFEDLSGCLLQFLMGNTQRMSPA